MKHDSPVVQPAVPVRHLITPFSVGTLQVDSTWVDLVLATYGTFDRGLSSLFARRS